MSRPLVILGLLLSFLIFTGSANAGVIFSDEEIIGDRGNENITLSASGLAVHNDVTINFDLFIQDSWDGATGSSSGPDVFGFKVDGIEIFSASFDNFNPLVPFETNTVAATSTGNFNSIDRWTQRGPDRYFDNYKGGFTIAHTGSTLDLTFFGRGLQGLSDESWRVDDIDVATDTAAVPEPTVFALSALGLVGLGVTRRKSHD